VRYPTDTSFLSQSKVIFHCMKSAKPVSQPDCPQSAQGGISLLLEGPLITQSSVRGRVAIGRRRVPSGARAFIRRCRRALAAALFCVLAAFCLFAQQTSHSSEKTQSPKQTAIGRQTFESTCAACHGLDGKGGERGPDIATRPEIVRKSDDELSKILRTGIPQAGMPAFASLGPATISDTVRHLRFLQGKGVATPLPGNSDKGKEIFAGKAGCSECHMVQGLGGFLGPDLSNYGASHSVSDIRGAIVSPGQKSGVRKSLAKATTKDGQTVTGLVRNEDNFSMQLQSLDGALHLLAKSEVADLTFSSKPLMPEDYATKLSQSELDHVIAYLLSVAHEQEAKGEVIRKPKKKNWDEE